MLENLDIENIEINLSQKLNKDDRHLNEKFNMDIDKLLSDEDEDQPAQNLSMKQEQSSQSETNQFAGDSPLNQFSLGSNGDKENEDEDVLTALEELNIKKTSSSSFLKRILTSFSSHFPFPSRSCIAKKVFGSKS